MARTQIQLGALTGSLGPSTSQADIKAAPDYAGIAAAAAMTPENNKQDDLAGILQLSFEALSRINGKADPLSAAKGTAYHTEHKFYLDDGSTQLAQLQTGLFDMKQAGAAIQIGNGSGGMGISHADGVLAADAELAGVVEGTSVHLGHADDSLVISNLVNDGDIHFLVSDGGNSKGLLKLQASDGSVRIGGGATVYADTFAELTTDGDINFSNDIKLANSKQIILQGNSGDDVAIGVSNGTSDYRMMLPTAAGTAGQVLKIQTVLGNFGGENNSDLQLAWQDDGSVDPSKLWKSIGAAGNRAYVELDCGGNAPFGDGAGTANMFTAHTGVAYKKVDVYLNGQLLRPSAAAATKAAAATLTFPDNNGAVGATEWGQIVQVSFGINASVEKFAFVSCHQDTFTSNQPAVACSSVNAGANKFVAANHGLVTGDRVRLSGVADLTGVANSPAGESYFAIRLDNNEFQVATTLANANTPTPVTFTDGGSGAASFARAYIKEYDSLVAGDIINGAGGAAAAVTHWQLTAGKTDGDNGSGGAGENIAGKHDDVLGCLAVGPKAGGTDPDAYDILKSIKDKLDADANQKWPDLLRGITADSNDATDAILTLTPNIYYAKQANWFVKTQKNAGNEAIGTTAAQIAGANIVVADFSGGSTPSHDYGQGSTDEESIVFTFDLQGDDLISFVQRP